MRDHLTSKQPLRDLDLLIYPGSLLAAVGLLLQKGFVVHRYPIGTRFKLAMSGLLKGKLLRLDLHTKPVQNNLVFLDVDSLFARIKKVNGYWVPCDEDQLILLVVHNIVGKKVIQAKHLPVIEDLLRRPLDWDRIRHSLSSFGIAEEFLRIVERLHDYALPGQTVLTARRKIYRKLLVRNWYAFPKFFVARLAKIHTNCRIRRRGTLIALIGPDGTGKSTLAGILARRLSDIFGYSIPIHYMGPWGYHQLKVTRLYPFHPWAKGMRSFRSLREEMAGIANGKLDVKLSLRPGKPWLRAVQLEANQEISAKMPGAWSKLNSLLCTIGKYAVYHIKSIAAFGVLSLELLHRYVRIYAHLRRGQHVIADRYVFDLLTGSMHRVCKERRILTGILCYLFPKPDLCYVLHHDPVEIRRRKPDMDEDEIVRMLEVYDAIARRFGGIKVKTNMPPEELGKEILNENAVRSMYLKLSRVGR